MGAPDVIPGGAILNPTVAGVQTSTDVTLATHGDPVYGHSRGVFGRHPGCTLKTALNIGLRDAEHRESMARLFIQMPQQERQMFVNSCPPETRALAKVLCGVGEGASGGTGFVDFILQNASETFREKYQVVESLSDNFIVYVFGQQAVPFEYSGMLINSYQDDQRVWMTRLYQDILRGTQLARRRKLVRLRYDSVIVSGIFLGLHETVQGDLENGVPFSFTMQPTQYVIFTPAIGVPTKLQTAFTEGDEYGLTTTAIPDTSQLRVAAPPRPPLPTKVRKNEKTDSPIEIAAKKPVKVTKDRLKDRAGVGGKTPPTTYSKIRKGIIPRILNIALAPTGLQVGPEGV